MLPIQHVVNSGPVLINSVQAPLVARVALTFAGMVSEKQVPTERSLEITASIACDLA